MSDFDDRHRDGLVFDMADKAVIAYAVFPEISKFRAVQGFA